VIRTVLLRGSGWDHRREGGRQGGYGNENLTTHGVLLSVGA